MPFLHDNCNESRQGGQWPFQNIFHRSSRRESAHFSLILHEIRADSRPAAAVLRRSHLLPAASLHNDRANSLLFQTGDGVLHLVEMEVGIARVGHVNDFAIQADEEADPARHFPAHHLHTVSVSNFAVGIGQQAEIQLVISNELFVAFGGIETDADDLDVVGLQARSCGRGNRTLPSCSPGCCPSGKIKKNIFVIST